MSELILDLVRRKVGEGKVRRVSSNKGGEYHSPCPVCDGDDRFHVWPNQDGGETAQRAGASGTFWCRACGGGGDIIELLKFMDGLEYGAACRELHIELDESSHRRGFRPLKQPKRGDDAWAPTQWKVPSEKWRDHATKLALAAHEQLLSTPRILAYLAKRGLPLEAVQRYRLGYLEGEDKTKTCLYRARAAFDLPERRTADGTKVRSSLWIPRGLTIPLWSGEEVHRIRFRRRKEDLQDKKSGKYLCLEGSGQAPMALAPEGVADSLATWVVVEAELDAIAVHHACGAKVGVLAALTNLGKPDVAAHRQISKAKLVLVATDFDAPDSKGNRPGYKGWLWWKECYPVARRWPVPMGKDPGEAFALGLDLAEWIGAGTPDLLGDAGAAYDALARDFSEVGYRPVPRPPYVSGILGQSPSGLFPVGGGASGVSGPLRWAGARAETPLSEATFPPDCPHPLKEMRRAYAGCAVTDDLDILCPKGANSWRWCKHGDCRACEGHAHCVVELLTSPQMLGPMEVDR